MPESGISNDPIAAAHPLVIPRKFDYKRCLPAFERVDCTFFELLTRQILN